MWLLKSKNAYVCMETKLSGMNSIRFHLLSLIRVTSTHTSVFIQTLLSKTVFCVNSHLTGLYDLFAIEAPPYLCIHSFITVTFGKFESITTRSACCELLWNICSGDMRVHSWETLQCLPFYSTSFHKVHKSCTALCMLPLKVTQIR